MEWAEVGWSGPRWGGVGRGGVDWAEVGFAFSTTHLRNEICGLYDLLSCSFTILMIRLTIRLTILTILAMLLTILTTLTSEMRSAECTRDSPTEATMREELS